MFVQDGSHDFLRVARREDTKARTAGFNGDARHVFKVLFHVSWAFGLNGTMVISVVVVVTFRMLVRGVEGYVNEHVGNDDRVNCLRVEVLVGLIFVRSFFRLIHRSPTLFQTSLCTFVLFFKCQFYLRHGELFFFRSLCLLENLSFSAPRRVVTSANRRCYCGGPPDGPAARGEDSFRLRRDFQVQFPRATRLGRVEAKERVVVNRFQAPYGYCPAIVPALRLMFVKRGDEEDVKGIKGARDSVFLQELRPSSQGAASGNSRQVDEQLTVSVRVDCLSQVGVVLLLVRIDGVRESRSFEVSGPRVPFHIAGQQT